MTTVWTETVAYSCIIKDIVSITEVLLGAMEHDIKNEES